MSIRIVADSTCDLPGELTNKLNITIIPTCINIGDRTYLDGVDLSRDEFYERLPNFPSIASTSAPGPDTFINTYRRLAEEGADEIISIHPPAEFSNLFNVAQLAAAEVKRVRITPLDLGQVTLGTGLLAVMAARAVKAGETLDSILKMLRTYAAKTYTFAALDTMEFLRRSGRVPALVASIGSLLSIKPVATLYAGSLRIDKVRTSKSALERLIKLVTNIGPLEELSIVHAHARGRAEELFKRLAAVIPIGKETLVVEATPILGTHVGLGAVAAVAIAK